MLIKQSSTARALVFFMYDSADHVTGKTGLSPTVVISKNGGSFASPAGAVTEIGNGFYKVAPNATDTNTLGRLALSATASGADQATMGEEVVAYDPDVANLAANVTQFGGTNLTAASGIPEVKTASIAAGAIVTASFGTCDFTSTMKASIGTAVAASAVASVTGNVGGNVVGSVASVTAAVSITGDLSATMKASVTTAATASTPTVTAGTVSDKTGYSLTQTFPTNFADLAITSSTGRVTAGTVSDKTGYALTQSFPSNFATLAINGSGHVVLQDASLVTAKLGTFALAKTTNITGFNDIAATAIVSGGAINTSSGAISTVIAVTGGVTVSTVSADAISASAVAASAVAKIQAGLSTYAGGDTAGTTTLLARVTGPVTLASVWTPTKAGYLDAAISSISGGGGGGGGSGLSGPSSVTLTFEDANGAPVALVDFTIQGQGPGRAGTDGVCAFGLANGDYTIIAAPRAGVVFENASLTVSGTTTATVTGTAVSIAAPDEPAQTTGYVTMRDGQGAPAALALLTFELVTPPGVDSYSTAPFTATANGEGLLTVALRKSTQYRARRGDSSQSWVPFTTGSGGTYALPQILGVA